MDRSTSLLVEAQPMVLTTGAPLYFYARPEDIYPSMALGIKKEEDYSVPSLIGSTMSAKIVSISRLIFIAYGGANMMVEKYQSEQTIKALQDCGAPIQFGVHIEAGRSHIWDILDSKADIPTSWHALSAIF